MTQANESTPPTGKVVLYGDCNIIGATAVIFAMIDWDVTVVTGADKQQELRARFDGFRDGASIRLETPDAQSDGPADYYAFCLNDGVSTVLPPLRAQATVLELSGVVHDDGEDLWTSCSDLVADMSSGFGMLTRLRDGDKLSQPFLPPGTIPSYFLALQAVYLATATLNAAEKPERLRVTAQEALLSALHFTVGPPQVPPELRSPPPSVAQGTRVGGSFDCLDGQVFVLTPTPDLWQPLVALLWKDAWAEQPWAQDMSADSEEQSAALNEALVEYCATRTRLEIVQTFQAAGSPTSYHASAEDVINNPQLIDRGFVSKDKDGELVLGRPYRITVADHNALPAPSRAEAPLGTKYLPFAGLTVCDMSWWWAGPFAGMCLSLLGATVIKVEGRTKVDHHRMQRPFIPSDRNLYDRSFIHFQSGRNKLSLAVNLKHPQGIQTVKDVIASSDILVSNFQPGLLRRLGLDFDVAKELVGARPFVFAALSGFGATGPWRDFRSFGANLAAFGGLARLTGTPETGPVEIGSPFADPVGGSTAAVIIAAMLRKARVLQTPVYFDLSQFEAQELMFNEGLRIGRQTGNWRIGDLAGTGTYRCTGDDEWVAVSIRTPKALVSLRALLGLPASDATPTSDPALEAALTAWTSSRTKDAAARELRAHGLDSTAVMPVSDLLHDVSLERTAFWYRVDPEEGGEMLMEQAPWRVDGKRTAAVGRAPRLGEHNERVLTQIVGYTIEKVRDLEAAGVLE